MLRPQVTITLGSSGQKVVKKPLANSDSFLDDAPSGSKRIVTNSILEDSSSSANKRSIDEALGLPPPRPIDTSRNGYVMHYDLLDPSHLNGLASMIAMTSSMRTSLDMCKPVKEFPPASGSTLKSLFLDKPLTVSTLLHSLGFGKYAIHFQSEEVDIVTLKQMGDHDLKELGTPMRPRKKILLAMLARSK